MDKPMFGPRLRIFALGGNLVAPSGEFDPVRGRYVPPDVGAQWRRTAESCVLLAEIIRAEPEVACILTHGNGPQVGNVLLRAEYSAPILHTIPLDVCGANTQGAMGYMFAQLGNALSVQGLERPTAEIVTRVVVDPEDSEFQNPTKFIGSSYTKEEAEKRQTEGITWAYYKRDEQGREIWRRVVPSPVPKDIVEVDHIEALLAAGTIPIAAGGGGIPVIRVQPTIEGDEEVYRCRFDVSFRRPRVAGAPPATVYAGREAVVDKDMSAAMLGLRLMQRAAARGQPLEAELIILTDVECVKLDFQTPQERDLRHLTLAEAQALFDAGIFPAGSMGPKIRAGCAFLREGGQRVLITNLENFRAALTGQAGTTLKG